MGLDIALLSDSNTNNNRGFGSPLTTQEVEGLIKQDEQLHRNNLEGGE